MIPSEPLVCHLMLVGYRMFQTMAISICLDWRTWLNDTHFQKKGGGRTEAVSCMLAGTRILSLGRYLSYVVVYSYLC